MNTPLKIKTPKKEIIKRMLSDEWINLDAVIENTVSIELILMYQHGIVPLSEPGMNWDQTRFLNITIAGQIKAHEHAVDKCKFQGQFRDAFYEGLATMHETQLSILRNLKNLMITQYN